MQSSSRTSPALPPVVFFEWHGAEAGARDAALDWLRQTAQRAPGALADPWTARLVATAVAATAGADLEAASQAQSNKRARSAPPPPAPLCGGYLRCSRRHAEVDCSLLGPNPLAEWRRLYRECLAASSAAAAAAADGNCFVVLLLGADRMPPELAAALHGFRASVWDRPGPRRLVLAPVGRFLPCAALRAAALCVHLPCGGAPIAPDCCSVNPVAAAALARLQRLLPPPDDADRRRYPFAAVRDELYRAQMFCVGLPEIVERMAATDPAAGAIFLASPACRAALGDWAARSHHIFHAEVLIHAFFEASSGGSSGGSSKDPPPW